ncbi:DeoR/GlpR family DNA-binding transcription regulator [Bifidobacterium sp. ESL0764]|uniref:DeoR/GlpR family DNA-binding transcription regulator n=1 Tax=Bifidobacterium sp. ESL0764 TaxID=2983228 RepID=UPI0023F94824|nr:DeoR/GlpR family DNA-binding transcription regulator [Bifidobacterium sp. ESL0764]WEV66040.1 DeoR/GlpR family DNA-binding transcription regulator [Bifidobacterium sp. ESL0764]
METRTNRILELLTEHKRIEVATLAEELGVSEVTMRKDLSGLEKRGIIDREHGFAVLKSADNMESRLAYHYEEKLKIARRAAECVHDGDTVMIENGSTCALLAAELVASKNDLTIITNSAFVAGYVRGKSQSQIILLGGIYQQTAQVMVGPMVERCLKGMYVDILFAGTDGYSEETGFANRDSLRAETVCDMAQHAGRVVVVTESSKFSRRGTVPLDFGNKDVSTFTDDGLSDAARKMLDRHGVDIVTV